MGSPFRQDRQVPDFAVWYQEQAPRALLALREALGDDTLAEESVAEAFAKAFARWPQVSAMESPTGWVYVVALNHARSHFRRHNKESDLAARSLHTTVTPGPDVDDTVWQAVRGLPSRARTAVALRYIADLPEQDVARLMGVSRGTVAVTLHRARATLAERLRPDYARDTAALTRPGTHPRLILPSRAAARNRRYQCVPRIWGACIAYVGCR